MCTYDVYVNVCVFMYAFVYVYVCMYVYGYVVHVYACVWVRYGCGYVCMCL